MTDLKQLIDKDGDYTLIKSGGGRTLILVKKGGVIKGKVLCKNFMDLDIEKMENFQLMEQDKLNNDKECPENTILEKIKETTKDEPTDEELRQYKRKLPKNLLNSITRNVTQQDDRNKLLKAIVLVNPKKLKKIEQETPQEINKYVTNFSSLLSDIKKQKEMLKSVENAPEINHQNKTNSAEVGFNTDMLNKVRNLYQNNDDSNDDWTGGKHSQKKTYHKRDKFGRFIKNKTRKSWH